MARDEGEGVEWDANVCDPSPPPPLLPIGRLSGDRWEAALAWPTPS